MARWWANRTTSTAWETELRSIRKSFPTLPNQPTFGSARVDPGKPYHHRMVYRLSIAGPAAPIAPESLHMTDTPQRQAPLARLVRQSRQYRHDRALSRALPEFRPQPARSCSRASRSSASPRPARDLSPCNRHHLVLAERVREGIREAGRHRVRVPGPPDPGDRQAPDRRPRPQPRLSRPGRGALRLSARRRGADHRLRQDHARLPDGGGDGEHPGDRACRSGRCSTAGTRASAPARARSSGRRASCSRRARSTAEGFIELVASSAPSTGYCNTMGTATTMNSLAEALGMSLPGSAAIPAPYRDRQEMRLSHRQAHRRDGAGGPASPPTS